MNIKVALVKILWDNRGKIIPFVVGLILLPVLLVVGVLSDKNITTARMKELHCNETLTDAYALDLSNLTDQIKTYSDKNVDFLNDYYLYKVGNKCNHIKRISLILKDLESDGIIDDQQVKWIYDVMVAIRGGIHEMQLPFKEFQVLFQKDNATIVKNKSSENLIVTAVANGIVEDVLEHENIDIVINDKETKNFKKSIKIKNKVYAGKDKNNNNLINEYYTYLVGFTDIKVKPGQEIKIGDEIGLSKEIYWSLQKEDGKNVNLAIYVPELRYQLEIVNGTNSVVALGENKRLIAMERIVPVVDWYVVTAVVGWYAPFGKQLWHNGVDLASPLGTRIVSATDGIVHTVAYNSGFGNYVYIENNGIRFIYAHLNERAIVNKGDKVIKGQVIGYMGTTGFSTGSHLHFEIRDLLDNYKVINPELYFNFKK